MASILPGEGYVKFECTLQPGPAPALRGVQTLIAARQRLYRLKLIGAYPDGIGYGNISRRVGESARFIVSGTATGGLARLTPKHFVVVTDYSFARNRVTCRGPIRASAESMTHAAVYACDPRIRAVVHVHNLSMWERLLAGDCARTPAEVEYGTPAMAIAMRRAVRSLPDIIRGVVVMAGHKEGVLTFGRSLAEAMALVLALAG